MENNKVRIYIIILVIIIAVCVGIMFVPKFIDKNSNFFLKDENCFIIELHEAYTNTYSYKEYYEVDFNNDKIILRRDDNGYSRKNMGTIKKENVSKLKSLINEIINNEENLVEILHEETHILYRQNIKYYYTIKAYDDEVYYVKDTNDIKRMQEMLL